MVLDQVQGASVGKTTATPMRPDDAQFLGALTGAIEKYGNTPSPYAGAQFAGPGALPLDAINVTASGSTSGLGALYGTGYDGAFAAWSDDTRLNLNDAAFRSTMSGTSTDIRLAQTDGGFWRGLAGDTRNVFEAPAPLSEKIGAGVRALGEFIADPLIEVGNQYRDLASAATGATGGWHSTFAQQFSDGSYGGAALAEFGAVAGATTLTGAIAKGVTGTLAAAGAGQKSTIVYRALTPADAISIEGGGGIMAKAPNGTWTASEHVANSGPGIGGAAANSPWISTTRSLEVSKAYDGGNGIIAIDLNKLNSMKVEVWQAAPRVNGVDGLAYHRSIWSQEVTIYQSIPPKAIIGPVRK